MGGSKNYFFSPLRRNSLRKKYKQLIISTLRLCGKIYFFEFLELPLYTN